MRTVHIKMNVQCVPTIPRCTRFLGSYTNLSYIHTLTFYIYVDIYWSKYGSKSSLEIGEGGLRSTTFVAIYQNVRLGL